MLVLCPVWVINGVAAWFGIFPLLAEKQTLPSSDGVSRFCGEFHGLMNFVTTPDPP